MTVLAQLIATDIDNLEYRTYVFKCLGDDVTSESKYIMCVRYPNWNHRQLQLGETGFLTFEEIRAGVDTWYNGKRMIPYKYNAIQFLKFISKPDKLSHEYVM